MSFGQEVKNIPMWLKEHALEALLSEMDVPESRIKNRDWRWVSRNLAVRNANHPLYNQAKELLEHILAARARGDHGDGDGSRSL